MTFVSTVTALSPSVWYRCNDAIGSTTVADSSGNGYNGSLVSTAGQSPILQCGGFTGDGNHSIATVAGAFIQVPNGAPGTTYTSAFSIVFIARPLVNNGSQFICGWSGTVNGQGWDVNLTGNAIGCFLSAQSTNSGSNYNFPSGATAYGTPFMMTITYNGSSGNWIVYANGTQVLTVNNALTFTPSGSPTLKFGQAYNAQGPGSSFCGQFQDIMIFNSVLSLTNVTALYNAAAPNGFLTNPGISLSQNPQTNPISWSAPTAGTSPYSYKLTRSTTSSYLPSPADTAVYTGTALTYTDTPSDSKIYYYHLSAIDAVGNTMSSREVLNTVSPTASTALAFGAIGDSRTYGANGTTTYVQDMQEYLQVALGPTYPITTSNAGVSGSVTAGWVSGQTNLTAAISQFTTLANAMPSGGKFYVMINLGVNDAEVINLTSVSTYIANLSNTITALKAANFKNFAGVILHQTFGVTLGVAPVAYDELTMALINQYNAALSTIVDNVSVFLGDTQAFKYFVSHPSEFFDGLHPNTAGYLAWGTMAAQSVLSILNPTSSSSQSGTIASKPGSAYQLSSAQTLTTPSGIVNLQAGQSVFVSYPESTD